LIKQFESRRVHGVAPEVAVKVLVLLKQQNGNLLPGQQRGQHQTGWPAANDAAGG